MKTSGKLEDSLKLGLEPDKPLCRCCLTTEKRMLNVTKVGHYFLDLAGINVLSSDGLPPWICFECNALLEKATLFKYKVLRAHSMLYEYITRCAPFPIDAEDPELAQYATPYLSSTHTLTFENGKAKHGFQKVLEHEKQLQTSSLDTVELFCNTEPNMSVDPGVDSMKEEHGLSDCEDTPLLDLRATATEILNEFMATEEIKTESEVKKKKKKKETKSKKRSKSDDETDADIPEKKTIRRQIEIDPEKIRVIILNPEEQVKQREEESKASLKFPYQCNLCFKGFNFEGKLQNHMTKHSPSRGPYECKLCAMYLPTSYSYTVHMHIHTRRYECVQCGRRMVDRASIYHHYRTQHEGITTLITCSLCGKVSSNSKTHRGHMRNHHSGERPKCDQCGKSFVNKDSLTEHLQIHEGVKNYECSVCGKRCRTRTQIKHHQLKHTDVRDFYCVECDARFKTAHSLRQHLQKSLKHVDIERLKYPCPRCTKRYPCARLLSQHVSVRHEGERAHPCAACPARLASRAALRKHARAHNNVRAPPAHVCHTCGHAFRARSVLVNHVRTHTGERPFVCVTCGRAFAQRTAMRTHQRRGHCAGDKGLANKPVPMPVSETVPKEEPSLADPWRTQPVFFVTAGP